MPQLRQKLLHVLELSKGEALSGEYLAEQLSVSRNSVWKAIEALRAEGHEITSLHSRGYVYSGTNDILSKEGITANLRDKSLGENIHVYSEVSSTSTVLKQLAEGGACAGTAVIADTQTGGRGRRGRGFFSSSGNGLYMSVLMRPQSSAADSTTATAAAAVAVAETLRKYSDREVLIKWVNDIVIGGKKVCGILTEGSVEVESGHLNYMVIGIGINIRGEMPPELRDIACSLGSDVSRNALCADILEAVSSVFGEPWSDVLVRYRRYSGVLGKRINIYSSDDVREGMAVDIDEQARLIADVGGARVVLNSGEISVRSV
jgi:BirA family biotin operon repressor/biotin-[acetyl-CoA-carboxylase] ligase